MIYLRRSRTVDMILRPESHLYLLPPVGFSSALQRHSKGHLIALTTSYWSWLTGSGLLVSSWLSVTNEPKKITRLSVRQQLWYIVPT